MDTTFDFDSTYRFICTDRALDALITDGMNITDAPLRPLPAPAGEGLRVGDYFQDLRFSPRMFVVISRLMTWNLDGNLVTTVELDLLTGSESSQARADRSAKVLTLIARSSEDT